MTDQLLRTHPLLIISAGHPTHTASKHCATRPYTQCTCNAQARFAAAEKHLLPHLFKMQTILQCHCQPLNA
jgi:hypothetical protein